jgi:hypothetical protein
VRGNVDSRYMEEKSQVLQNGIALRKDGRRFARKTNRILEDSAG